MSIARLRSVADGPPAAARSRGCRARSRRQHRRGAGPRAPRRSRPANRAALVVSRRRARRHITVSGCWPSIRIGRGKRSLSSSRPRRSRIRATRGPGPTSETHGARCATWPVPSRPIAAPSKPMRATDAINGLRRCCIPTGSIALDLALGVGVPPRTGHRDFRPRISDKTTVCSTSRRGPGWRGRASSSTPSTRWTPATPTLGVNIDDLLVSQPDTGEQALEITETLVRSSGIDVHRRRFGGGPGAQGRNRRRDGRQLTWACRLA